MVKYTPCLLFNYPLLKFKSVQFTIIDFEKRSGYNIVKYPVDNLK
nr:MAG TPA: hypothetical protein [Caudoviricetes sp.]